MNEINEINEDLEEIRYLKNQLRHWKYHAMKATLDIQPTAASLYKKICELLRISLEREVNGYEYFRKHEKHGAAIRLFEPNGKDVSITNRQAEPADNINAGT
jgi:hypothetical protein